MNCLPLAKKRSNPILKKKDLEPTEKSQLPAFFRTDRLGSLKVGDRTLEEFAREKIANGETIPISPGYAYDQVQITLSEMQRHETKIETEHTLDAWKWMESLAFDHSYLKKLLKQGRDQPSGTSSAFLPQSKQAWKELESNLKNTQLDDKGVSSKQEESFVSEKGKGPINQLDIPPRSSSPSLPLECHSPLEERVEKSQYCVDERQYWANLGGCTACLVVISHIALAILRRLHYTQQLVKKLTDRGVPKWLFSLITSSNAEQHAEKDIFNLMVSILAINFLILYLVFNMF